MNFFKTNKKYIIVLLVILLLFIIWQTPVRSFFYSLTRPIGEWLWQKGEHSSGFLFGWWHFGQISRENEQLKEENFALLSKLTDFYGLQEENEKLRKAMDLELKQEYQFIEIKVFSQKNGKEEETYLINKGQEDGITKGMPVINFEKMLVGRISEVYKNSSEMRLISHPSLKFSARIQGADIMGLAQGSGEKQLGLGLIPKEKKLEEGQILITDGLEGGFPAGLLVGRVRDIKRTDLEAFQEATVIPFFTLKDLSSLLVIINIRE